jgi:hypothetical protein
MTSRKNRTRLGCACFGETVEDPMWGRRNDPIASAADALNKPLEKLRAMIYTVSSAQAQEGHLGHQQDIKEIERALTAVRQIVYNNSPRRRQDPLF